MNDLLLYFLNGVGWSLSHIIEKFSIDKMGPFYFLLVKFTIGGIIMTPILVYFIYKNKIPEIYNNNKIKFLKELLLLGTIATFITIISIGALFNLLSRYGPAFVIPISQSISLLLTTLLSVIILGEKITKEMLLGVLFIILGIFFIYKDKSKLNNK